MTNFKETCRIDIKNMLERLDKDNEHQSIIANIYEKLDTLSTIDNYVIREHLKDSIALEAEAQQPTNQQGQANVKNVKIVEVTINGKKEKYIEDQTNGNLVKYDPNKAQEAQNLVDASKIIVSAPDDPNAPADPTVQPAPVQEPAPADPNAQPAPAQQEPAPAPVQEPAPEPMPEPIPIDRLSIAQQEFDNLSNKVDHAIKVLSDMKKLGNMATILDHFKDKLDELKGQDLNDPEVQQKYDSFVEEIKNVEPLMMDETYKDTPGADPNANPSQETEEKLEEIAEENEEQIGNDQTELPEPPENDVQSKTKFDEDNPLMSGAEDDTDVDDTDMDDKIKTLRKDESADAPSDDELDSKLDFGNEDIEGSDDFGDFSLDDMPMPDDLDFGGEFGEETPPDIDNIDDTNSDEKVEEAKEKLSDIQKLLEKLFNSTDDTDEELKEEIEDKVEEAKDTLDGKETEDKEEDKTDEEPKDDDTPDDDIDFEGLDLDSLDEEPKSDKEEKEEDKPADKEEEKEEDKTDEEPVEEQLTPEQMKATSAGSKSAISSENFDKEDIKDTIDDVQDTVKDIVDKLEDLTDQIDDIEDDEDKKSSKKDKEETEDEEDPGAIHVQLVDDEDKDKDDDEDKEDKEDDDEDKEEDDEDKKSSKKDKEETENEDEFDFGGGFDLNSNTKVKSGGGTKSDLGGNSLKASKSIDDQQWQKVTKAYLKDLDLDKEMNEKIKSVKDEELGKVFSKKGKRWKIDKTKSGKLALYVKVKPEEKK